MNEKNLKIFHELEHSSLILLYFLSLRKDFEVLSHIIPPLLLYIHQAQEHQALISNKILVCHSKKKIVHTEAIN